MTLAAFRRWIHQRGAAHVTAAVDFLLPPKCVACHAAVLPEQAFCTPCAATLIETPDTWNVAPNPSCADRESYARPWTSAVAGYFYGGQLATALARLKYAGQADVARPVARLLAQRFPALLRHCNWIVPVPLHPRRLAERGYNQAALLAAELSRAFAWRQGEPDPTAAQRPRFAPEVLCRTRLTPNQTRLGRQARLANALGLFRVSSAALHGARVLLVDDVLTTGATAAACAVALLRAGTREVHVLTLARTSP